MNGFISFKGEIINIPTEVIVGSPNFIDIYSIEERLIGVWTDGKPLYRKCISAKFPSQSQAGTNVTVFTDTTISVVNSSMYIKSTNGVTAIRGPMFAYEPGGTNPMYITWYWTSGTYNIRAYASNTSWYGSDMIVVLEYTKNADQAVMAIPQVAPTIEEYETDDGWYVRKWSSGYIEMTLLRSTVIALSRWNFGDDGWGTLDPVFVDTSNSNPSLPVPLVKLIDASHSIITGKTGNTRSVVVLCMQESRTPFTTAPNVSILRRGAMTGDFNLTISTKVIGFWKEPESTS